MPITSPTITADPLDPAGTVSVQAAIDELVGHLNTTIAALAVQQTAQTTVQTRLEEQLRILNQRLRRVGA